MKRRNFIKTGAVIITGLLIGSKETIIKAANKAADYAGEYKNKILSLIKDLKAEGSNIVLKIMNGKQYVFDPYNHYPYDGGIKDENTGYQLFFHAHRDDEYGHFHTFATDDDGELVHLLLISMNKKGEPIGLATVNRWVTGDKYVKADKLKKLSENFYINPSLYKDYRVIEFINNVYLAYPEMINSLYEKRDQSISEYARKYYREPFEDRELEILSFAPIKDFNGDVNKNHF